MAHGRQRYRCEACGRSFTATPPRGKPPAMKALAVLLYGLGNVSQGMIAKLLGVSHVAVYYYGVRSSAPYQAPRGEAAGRGRRWRAGERGSTTTSGAWATRSATPTGAGRCGPTPPACCCRASARAWSRWRPGPTRPGSGRRTSRCSTRCRPALPHGRSPQTGSERAARRGVVPRRVARGGEGADPLLALAPAGDGHAGGAGRDRQAALARRAGLRGAEAGDRARPLRGPGLARLPPPRLLVHRGLRLPGGRALPLPLRAGGPSSRPPSGRPTTAPAAPSIRPGRHSPASI